MKKRKLIRIMYVVTPVMLVLLLALNIFTILKVKAIEDGAGIDDTEDVAQENDVQIGGDYIIRATTQISDAYKSGDTSKLSDADKETLDMAKRVLDEIITDGMSDYEKELAVYEWMCANIGFDDGSLEVIPNVGSEVDNPHGVLKYHQAVCVGYATTFRMFMQMMDIEPTRAAHDALGDAYHTALVCRKLHLAEGIAAYEAAVQAHENGFHGAELPGCVQRAVFHGYADKTAALSAMSGRENRCPVCGGQMTAGKWYTQQGRRYLSCAHCETDGEFYIRVRLVQEDGALRVSRLVYEPTEQVAKSYAALSQKPRPRRARRRAAAQARHGSNPPKHQHTRRKRRTLRRSPIRRAGRVLSLRRRIRKRLDRRRPARPRRLAPEERRSRNLIP